MMAAYEPDSRDKAGLRQRLLDLWQAKRFAEFYAVVGDELAPIITANLRNSCRCTHEEAEDCLYDALEGLLACQDERHGEIGDPYNYAWGSAKNAAFTMKGRQAREKEAIGGKAATENGIPTISDSSALVLISEVVGEVEAEEGWAGPVVREAVEMLPASLKRVARHDLATRVDYNSKHGAEDLGIPPTTYRAYRSKAHKKLRSLIPAVMREHGVDARYVAEPESVFQEPSTFMSEEEGEG